MKTCGECDKLNKTICYPTAPPKYDCAVTGQCHSLDDVCDVEPDKDINVPGKPLGEWTLREIKKVCARYGCMDCPFYSDRDAKCIVETTPNDWDLGYIPQVPPLTEPEITIMRAVGAKWVSRDHEGSGLQVSIWTGRPRLVCGTYLGPDDTNYKWLGNVASALFPSVNPGDCIGLRDMEDDAV